MATLKIVFSGLCGFVFDKPLADLQQAPSKVSVLMPQLLLPRVLSNGPQKPPDVLDAHFPQLIFTGQPAAGSTVKGFVDHATGRTMILLSEQTLQFVPDGPAAANGLTLNRQPLTDLATNNVVALQSLLWMVDMVSALPASKGRVNPGLLQQSPSAAGSLIARIEIGTGTLSTLEVSSVALNFSAPGDLSFNRRIATKVLLEVPVTSQVEINMTGPGAAQQKLVLQAPQQGDFLIEICNLEIDKFLTPPQDLVYQPKDSAADFEAFYGMAAGFGPGAKAPSLNFASGFQSIHGGMCPPVSLASTGGG